MSKIIIPQNQIQKEFPLYKRITTIGKNADIKIECDNIQDILAYISQSNGCYELIVSKDNDPAIVNNKSSRNIKLNDGTNFYLNNYKIIYKEKTEEKIKNKDEEKIIAYKKLVDFSLKIAKEKNIDNLLDTLLREIIDIIKAEHGFLVLVQENEPMVKARHYTEILEDSAMGDSMSDSIVKKVMEEKEPIIISDALNHEEFSSSYSVINFRLSSVMCVPLIYQGKILGAIYVGNNSLVNAFNQGSLEIMLVYASQAAMLVQNALHINELKVRAKNLQNSLEMVKFGGIIGACSGMQEVYSEIKKVAQLDVSIFIVGETGTGKELIARELHNHSLRKDGPLVIVNCGAISESLLESELFGHVRGAFLGASQSKIGKLQQAHGGTILLDEIGEIPLELQTKILSVIEEQKVCRIGDSKQEIIDVRIISSNTRDLLPQISENKFREDLYYRLNIVQINVPPLRERGNDILVLSNYFLQKYSKIYNKNILGLDEQAKKAVLAYDWPGNVRLLENRIKRAVVMCENERIKIEDLDIKDIKNQERISLSEALDLFRKRYINESLERNDGNRTKAAHELQIDPRTIFRHLEDKKKLRDVFDV